MKKRTLLRLLDIVTGLFIGLVCHDIFNHNADAVDWCIIAICFFVMVVRLYTIINAEKNK